MILHAWGTCLDAESTGDADAHAISGQTRTSRRLEVGEVRGAVSPPLRQHTRCAPRDEGLRVTGDRGAGCISPALAVQPEEDSTRPARACGQYHEAPLRALRGDVYATRRPIRLRSPASFLVASSLGVRGRAGRPVAL